MDQETVWNGSKSFADELPTSSKLYYLVATISLLESQNWTHSRWIFFATQLKDSSSNATNYSKSFNWEFNSSSK